ncbi:MAG: type 1 glutamine amidotransferase [Zoogloeaceae bacterium]|jgi:GMP synthase-like glutamine amidotransferase|nr:type 1 glutamine amidotransferase [Zoogloeaceae bacterium]
MRPVAIFRHAPIEGPGYFATFLAARNIPWRLIAIDEGAPIPADPADFSGLCLMGGPMSANDDLPWIAESLAFIRAAAQKNLPVLGHCLGGQLMAKAFGGTISRNPVVELGWGDAKGTTGEAARHWLGELAGQALTIFSWHGETFSLPPGAALLASTTFCANQIAAWDKHLALQCHVEMTPEMVEVWSTEGATEIAEASASPAVQHAAQMQAQTAENLPTMRRLADALYGRWIEGLAR